MKRSKAEELIDRIRQELVYQPDNGARVRAITRALECAGLRPLELCPGEAHKGDRPAYTDHCCMCAPRWGVVGERERVT